jgi:hypothetical protein
VGYLEGNFVAEDAVDESGHAEDTQSSDGQLTSQKTCKKVVQLT